MWLCRGPAAGPSFSKIKKINKKNVHVLYNAAHPHMHTSHTSTLTPLQRGHCSNGPGSMIADPLTRVLGDFPTLSPQRMLPRGTINGSTFHYCSLLNPEPYFPLTFIIYSCFMLFGVFLAHNKCTLTCTCTHAQAHAKTHTHTFTRT